MSTPTNLTPATATAIPTGTGLPFTATIAEADLQNVPTGSGYASTCDTAQIRSLWWAYTTGPNETWVSVSAELENLSAHYYNPILSVWSGSPLAQFTIGTQHFCETSSGKWFQIPVSANTRYYFQVVDQFAYAIIDTGLIFQVKPAPQLAAPQGSIAITDDTNGFPLMVLQADGTPARVLTGFPAGEHTAISTGGSTAVQNGVFSGALSVAVYTGNLQTVLGNWALPAGQAIRGIQPNGSASFLVMYNETVATSALTVKNIMDHGLVANTWTLPVDSVLANCFANDAVNQILYYGSRTASAVIHAYDLANSVPLADLHAAFGTEFLAGDGDGFVQGSQIVFGYAADIAGNTSKLRIFNSGGAVLHTYTLTSGDFVTLDHFRQADSTSVWVWGKNGSGDTSTMRRLLLSDGSILQEFTVDTTSVAGIGNDSSFSISKSCSLTVLADALPPPEPPLPAFPLGTPVEVPIRRLRRAPVLNSDGKWLFLKRFELDADVGHGAVTGQGQDPKVQLRISRDGGQTFGNIHTVSAGRLGQYRQRIRFLALGSGRNIVVEVVVSDPIAWAFYQAFADLAEGVS